MKNDVNSYENSRHEFEFWAKGEQFKSFFFWAFYQQTFWTSRLTRVYVCQEIKFSWHLLWCWWHFGKFAKCLLLKLKSVNFLFRVVKLFENLVNSTCYNFKIVYIILTNFFEKSKMRKQRPEHCGISFTTRNVKINYGRTSSTWLNKKMPNRKFTSFLFLNARCYWKIFDHICPANVIMYLLLWNSISSHFKRKIPAK